MSSQQLAFPGAEGFGKFASGGRGGSVIKVTNLNNSGTGSLRAALDASGPRTIVFEVGGTINLTSNIYVDNGDVTIAGQTAPGDGILIRGGMVQFEESNVIVRYLRFRPGPSAPSGSDAVSITAWTGNVVEDVIFDHCSFSWGDDENFNLRGVNGGIVRNVTIQNSIISENTYGLLTSTGCYNVSIYKNLFALNSERNIRSNYPVSGQLEYEMINNIIYGFRSATKPSLGIKFTVLNNHYKKSSQISPFDNSIVDSSSSGGGPVSSTYAYIDGNIIASGMTQNDSPLNPYLETTPYLESGIIPLPASLLESELLDNVGSSFPSRDAVDTRIVDHFIDGDGVISSSGTYPNIANGTAPTDTDDDGMPDEWENQNGLDQNDPTDRNIVQADGYTNLEYYLNGLVLDTSGSQVNISSNATNDSICDGEDVTLTASGAVSYIWSTGATTASITVSPNSSQTYSVTGTHTDSSTSQDSITITVNELPNANAGADLETCEGTAVTLTASGGTSYQWSTGESTQSITVNPNVTTTYTVQVTQNGCTSSDDVIVTVIEQPTVDAGADQTIFTGESAVLTATGADTYLWSTGETTQSITVNPTLDTSYAVTGFIGNCESTDTVTVFLLDDSVDANAGADTTICNGESVILTATGGTTYLWNTGATTASIEVSPTTTSTYTVTAFSLSGNNTDTDSVTVTVNDNPTVDAGADVTINEGESITLSASGADTYLWSTGETTESIIVSPNNTTTYNVIGNLNGCEATDSITVTVIAQSVTANAGDDVSICFGENTTLTANGGASYVWNTGETTQSITVSPTDTTTYTVTVFNSNQTQSDSDSVIVTVTELPAVNAGADVTIIENESTTLTATGADSYLWSTGETTASITVSPLSTTVYTVTGFLNGCEASDDLTVTVNVESVSANAGADVTICEGESTVLTASGGTTYLWNTGETTASISVSPNSTSTFTVTAFNANQTASDTDDVIVIVNELPNTNAGSDITIIEGETTTLTVTGADSYSWNTGETSASIQVNPTVTTTYIVTGFSNGCESSDEVTVTVEPFVFTASAGGDQVICQGYETTLTASEGDSYLWSTGETTQSITVNPSNTQTYTVTVFSGAYQDDADVTVSVNPNPNVVIINGDQVDILEGEFITLSATGANSYLWDNGATQPNIAVSPSVTTTYEVTGFINNCEDTKAVVVNVFENVVADAGDDVTICSQETVTLTATGGDEYLWNTGETTPTIEVSPEADTEYSVLVYNALSSDEAFVTVFVEDCSAAQLPTENESFDFLVFQDTTQDVLKVKINGLQSVNAKGITIYDISGKVLHSEAFRQADLENQSEMLKEINTSPYARGIYIVRLEYNDTSVIKKIPIR